MEGGKKGLWIGFAAVIAAAAGAGIYWNRSHQAPDLAPPPAPAQAQSPAQTPAVQLPKMEESDAFIRGRLKALSANPKLAEWLQVENLLRRVTAAVSIIAEGKSPRDSLKFLAPEKPFAAMKKGGKVVLDPQSFARYDLLADAVDSLPADGAARFFIDLKPLFQQAYEELGSAKGDFQEVLNRAIGVLLAVPAVSGDIVLRKKVISYAMVDETLENLSPAQKHLLRMGPKNQAKIQAKLRAISAALGSRP